MHVRIFLCIVFSILLMQSPCWRTHQSCTGIFSNLCVSFHFKIKINFLYKESWSIEKLDIREYILSCFHLLLTSFSFEFLSRLSFCLSVHSVRRTTR